MSNAVNDSDGGRDETPRPVRGNVPGRRHPRPTRVSLVPDSIGSVTDDYNGPRSPTGTNVGGRASAIRFQWSLSIILVVLFALFVGIEIRGLWKPQDRQHQQTQGWHTGGTLHRATMREWRVASKENQLATCADLAVVCLKEDGRTINSMVDVYAVAIKLMSAIDAFQHREHGENPKVSDFVNGMHVSEVAAMCWVIMK